MISWKTLLIIVAIIAVIGFLYIMSRRRAISFDFDMGGNIQNILGSIQGRYADPNARGIGLYVDVPLTTIIKNKSAGATLLQNILGSISYNGESIMQTKADSTVLQNVMVEGKSITPVTDSVQLLINPSSITFLSELIQGKKPLVKYNFATTIKGKPYQFTNTSTINN